MDVVPSSSNGSLAACKSQKNVVVLVELAMLVGVAVGQLLIGPLVGVGEVAARKQTTILHLVQLSRKLNPNPQTYNCRRMKDTVV